MYRKQSLPFDQIPQFSARDVAYQGADPALRPFYEHAVNISSFPNVVAARKKMDTDRVLLHQCLINQYSGLSMSKATKSNIDALLDPNTFTIVTAHQPSLLTGPLYFIYKICSIISLAAKLNAELKGNTIVPVFVLGGEDHDFEEIATLHLFNKDFTWATDQKGATGRMTLDGLEEVIESVKSTFGTMPHADALNEIIDTALTQSTTYGQFMIRLTNALFAEHGLVILNMDNAHLKEKLLPYIVKDLRQEDSQRLVQQDQEEIVKAGFKDQAHAREVNIFWHDGDRHRVIKEGAQYQVDTESLSLDELIAKISESPAQISPNVVLRPVYQEIILPNLAYIGGGGELAYWLERKSLFQEWNIPFPMLIRRDSVLLVDKKSDALVTESGLEISDLFNRVEKLVAQFAQNQTDININLNEFRTRAQQLFDDLKEFATKVDPTLGQSTLAEGSKIQKSIELIENKMMRAAKQKNETGINRITKTKLKFFPGNDSLQERYDNFIPYFLRYGHDWITALIGHLDPLDKSFKILIEE